MRYVYFLSGPDMAPRYVGQTGNVAARIKSHAISRNNLSVSPVGRWAHRLAARGLRPIATVVTSGRWSIARSEAEEAKVIASFLQAGHRLLNVRTRAFLRTSTTIFRIGGVIPTGISEDTARRNIKRRRKVTAA